MIRRIVTGMLILGFVLGSFTTAQAEEKPFRDLVGDVAVQDVKPGQLQVPFIIWGGDMATFYANGGLKTKTGSLFHDQGLNLQLTPGDDFVQQVRDYLSGKSPFLRGTYRMMGMASEVIGSDPRTKGVCILQMTWSAGDHMVVRDNVKTISDLKGKTVVLQTGGPHVGMLDDILKSAQLSWDDINVVWAKDLTGDNGPAEMFRKNSHIAACFVISPDMFGLSGDLRGVGTGAEGTIKGARVLVSTAELSRSIADVYVVRKDWYDKNKDTVQKFVAGYLRSCEKVIDLKKQYEASGSQEYMNLLKMSQGIYGEDVLPTLEEDAHGLLSDCTFVGYPGNVAFFTREGNLSGFEAFNKSAMDLATSRGYANVRAALMPSGFDYTSATFLNYLKKTEMSQGERFDAEAVLKEIEQLESGELDSRTILSFSINFEPNQEEFSAEQYGVEFQRVIEAADKYGNAVIAVRGHADPTKTLLELVKAGLKKGVLKRSGSRGDYKYSLNGKPLSLESTADLIRLIEAGEFSGVAGHNPHATMQAALNLSRKRADAVRTAIIAYAQSKGVHLDASQIQPVGAGIREPFIAKPSSMEEAKQNMRVEFRLLRIDAEASTDSDFDY
jgi:ABC-type nitrate/sulfonate/bicarbonate transport system substrate-binding protein/outer membrane protein OmpA-like peptidoglycan-associated protein